MRELKFRAWDTEAKCYLKDPILFDNFGQVYEVCDERSKKRGTCLITHHPNVIKEQCTGLKDKNGKDIYEGDIIEEEIDLGYETSVHRYIVKYDEDLLCWSLDKSNSLHEFLYETNLSRQVIGNIHENPDLLGKEK